MHEKEIDPRLQAQIEKLKEKYEAMGQDISSHLDGLFYSDYLTYWNYIHLDTLLSLQIPRTAFPDEKTFILYHQATELYFKMILNELEQIVFSDPADPQVFVKRLKRIISYFDHLIHSFDLMVNGMDREQFLAFRMALHPASGYQSYQYRFMEIYATDFIHLTKKEGRNLTKEAEIEEMYEFLYWRAGSLEQKTGKKTLTLTQFEQRYKNEFISLAHRVKKINVLQKYEAFFLDNQEVIDALKKFDVKANVDWPLQHFKASSRYLRSENRVIKASGKTDWQKYLPPKNRHIVFFPKLWTASELKEWGRKAGHL